MRIVTTIIACLLLLCAPDSYRLHSAEAAAGTCTHCSCGGKGCCSTAPVDDSQTQQVPLPTSANSHDWQFYPSSQITWKPACSDSNARCILTPDSLTCLQPIQIHILDCRFQI